jgi:predicted RNase H-like HicB family nuclease
MPTYKVFLDVSEEELADGGYLAHVPDLPGCVARGASKDGALQRVFTAIDAYIALMGEHGVRVPDADDPVELEIVETEVPTLPTDAAALTDADLADVERRAGASRAGLLALLREMPADALDWRADEESWSIRNVLSHLVGADLAYASRLEPGGLPELLWRLEQARAIVLGRLREVPDDARNLERDHMGESWTPRKVARRMLEHEQEHAGHIRQILGRYGKRSDGS